MISIDNHDSEPVEMLAKTHKDPAMGGCVTLTIGGLQLTQYTDGPAIEFVSKLRKLCEALEAELAEGSDQAKAASK